MLIASDPVGGVAGGTADVAETTTGIFFGDVPAAVFVDKAVICRSSSIVDILNLIAVGRFFLGRVDDIVTTIFEFDDAWTRHAAKKGGMTLFGEKREDKET